MTPEMATKPTAEWWEKRAAWWQAKAEAAEAALALAERKAEGAQLKAEQFGAVADDEYRKRRDLEDALAIAVGLKDASEAKNTALRAALALQAQPWQPIEKCPDFAEFIIGAWPVGDGSFDVGELSREGLHWFSIVGSREEPTHWMPLPSLPSAAAPVKENR